MGTFAFGLLLVEDPFVSRAELAASLLELAACASDVGATLLYLDATSASPPLGLDAFVALGAVGGGETALRLGCVAHASGVTPPALLAKYLAGLDLCCGGYAEMALCSGTGGEVAPLLEAHEVVTRLLTEAAVSYSGASSELSLAWNEPRGARRIPLGLTVTGPAEVEVLGRTARALDFVLIEEGVAVEEVRLHLARRGAPFPELLAILRSEEALFGDQARRALLAGGDGVLCALPVTTEVWRAATLLTEVREALEGLDR